MVDGIIEDIDMRLPPRTLNTIESSSTDIGTSGGAPVKKATAKKSTTRKSAKVDADGDAQISAYSQVQPAATRAICDALRELIAKALPKATSKVWHGSPVWFSDDNPVVGYSATAKSVKLLFWNGQAFDEPALRPVGKYGAAEAVFNDAAAIDGKVVRRWLKKARADVFDSKALFKKLREGK